MNFSEEYKRAVAKAFHLKQPENRMDFKPLIEARIEMLKPHLNDFTFEKLGDIGLDGELWPNQRTLHELRPVVYATMSSIATVNLNFQGIYGCENPIINTSIGLNGKMKIWGFSRSGFWLYGEIHFYKKPIEPCLWKAEYENELFIREVELSELIPIFVNNIWSTLGNFIKEIHKKQAEKFRITSEMSEVIEFEERLLQMTR